ncbi:MAG: radical SAM family heme chaperone HemW [Acidimicrobiia bacterium]
MTPTASQPGSGWATDVGFGVYVHIPFCAKRCDYCAFATWTDRHHLTERYVDACVAEIGRAIDAGLPRATSVFFGGGTPSLIPAESLMRILDAIDVHDECEVTVECNPDTVTEELMATYVAHGVNRVSFGVQSMVPHVLASLGRTHDPENVRRSVAIARNAQLSTFNLDLIYGVAGESVEDWRTTVQMALELDPPHISAYGLTAEAGTPLAADAARHPDDDVQADCYDVVDELLGNAGLVNYEISNWARPGHECRHNELYWRQGDYLGVGCAAHSHRRGRRWWNVRTPERYCDLIESGASTEAAYEDLDAAERRIEGLQLALRMADGVPIESLDPDGLDDLVEVRGDRVRLTRRGRLMANEISMRLQ